MPSAHLVSDLNPGTGGSYPDWLTSTGSSLLFIASAQWLNRDLWSSDGTALGTVRLVDLDPSQQGIEVTSLLVDGSLLFLGVKELTSGNAALLLVNLTTQGLSELRSFPSPFPFDPWYSYVPPVHQLTKLGSRVYFVAHGTEGSELWATDGSTAGTRIVRDIFPGQGNSDPVGLTVFNGRLVFTADDGSTGRELWISDGTRTGTRRLIDLVPGEESSYPEELTVAGNRLYFSAFTPDTGRELWRTDGTLAGTVLVADLYPGDGWSGPSELTAVGSKVFFCADDGSGLGYQLWMSDGTAEGTLSLTDTSSYDTFYTTSIGNLTAVGGRLFFTMSTPESGYELWQSDGTVAGTSQVADLWPGPLGSYPESLAAIGPDMLLFSADTDGHGRELWQSDGTASGTVGYDLVPGGEWSSPEAFTVVGGQVMFTAGFWGIGRELWTMDHPSPQPPASLAISPLAGSELEGDSGSTTTRQFRISRSGTTAVAMTVGWQVSAGSAEAEDSADADDFGGAWPTGGVSFPIGVESVEISVPVSGDLLQESDETFHVALRNPVGALLDPNASVAGGTILNDDSYTTIEAEGNASLLRHPTGEAVVAADGRLFPVTSPWNAPTGRPEEEWRMLAAESFLGGNNRLRWTINRILWRNNNSNYFHFWTLDSGWGWLSSEGYIPVTSPQAWELESSFQIDLNADGTIGDRLTSIEAKGNAALVAGSDGQAYVRVGEAQYAVDSPWGGPLCTYANQWEMLAAETLDGTNRILWRNNAEDALHLWTVDQGWDWLSSNETVPLHTPEADLLAARFQVDPGPGPVFPQVITTIEGQGNAALLQEANGRLLVEAGGSLHPVGSPWGATSGTNGSAWRMIGAETLNGTNTILWHHGPANFFHLWTLDATWNWQSSEGMILPDSVFGQELPRLFDLPLPLALSG